MDAHPVDLSVVFNSTIDDLGLEIAKGMTNPNRKSKLGERSSHPFISPEHITGWCCNWRFDDPNLKSAIPISRLWWCWYIPTCLCIFHSSITENGVRQIVAAKPTNEMIGPHSRYFAADYRLFAFHRSSHDFRYGSIDGLADGLVAYMRSTHVSEWLRDKCGSRVLTLEKLSELRFPSREKLCLLGKLISETGIQDCVSQEIIDRYVNRIASE